MALRTQTCLATLCWRESSIVEALQYLRLIGVEISPEESAAVRRSFGERLSSKGFILKMIRISAGKQNESRVSLETNYQGCKRQSDPSTRPCRRSPPIDKERDCAGEVEESKWSEARRSALDTLFQAARVYSERRPTKGMDPKIRLLKDSKLPPMMCRHFLKTAFNIRLTDLELECLLDRFDPTGGKV
ncbi:unnamed protein product, partial [Discosporangium mesarthrocarpum]